MNGLHRLPWTGPLRGVLPALALALVAACGSSVGGGDGAGSAADDAPAGADAAPAGSEARAQGTDDDRPRVRSGEALVIFGADTVVAEVARTPEEREQGLMNRDDVPDGTGMLFVFEEEAPRSFWMKDTYVALDIAYLNADLRIVSIHQMEPLDENTYPSEAPAMFALEVRQGWFAEHGIEAGDVAEIVFGG